MQLKEKIKFNGHDMLIQFPLEGNNGLLGLQQEIDRYTQISSINSINEGQDVEVRRFKFSLESIILSFVFCPGTNCGADFRKAGFSLVDIKSHDAKFLNSYFRLDYYNSFDPNNQARIFSAYLTNLGSDYGSAYPMNEILQYYRLEVPINYINAQTDNIVTGYTRFSFYNAKTGRIQLFYNNDNILYTTPDKFYFKTILNIADRTWRIETPSLEETYKIIGAKELIYTDNKAYIDKYNATVDNFDNLQQQYPDGDTFDFETGTYVNSDGTPAVRTGGGSGDDGGGSGSPTTTTTTTGSPTTTTTTTLFRPPKFPPSGGWQ